MAKIRSTWKGGMSFENQVGNHLVYVDDNSTAQAPSGPNPKPLLLVSLAGCTGIDVVALLEKMRVRPKSFSMDLEAPQSESHPKVYTNIQVRYHFEGDDIKPAKLIKAVQLSQEQYCGVTAMLRKNCPVEFEVYLNGERILKS